MARVWLSLAHMGGAEREYVREAFDTNWVVPLGPNVNGFESDLEQWLNRHSDHENHVVALSAGTAALHLGLVMLGVGKGDEVICQSFTFAASANPITYQGATPVFVDSEADTWNMDPELLEEAIVDRMNKTGKKPKAIIPVHLYGYPAKLSQLMAVAQKYDIPVLEDSAEAMGSTYDGLHCGTFGRFGVMSFNGNKMITTSGGGALICRSKSDADRVKFYATQARENFPYYQHEHIGYNYRLSNVCAGIGRGQMEVVDQHVARRNKIHRMYVSMLSGVDGIKVMEPKADKPSNPNFWLTCICVDTDRNGGKDYTHLSALLDSHDIETRPLWKPMHLQPVFSKVPAYVNGVAERMFNCGLCLPSGPMVTNDDVDRIVGIIKDFAGH